MLVYRLCKINEISFIIQERNFSSAGNLFDSSEYHELNTHKYERGVKYMHFFKDPTSLFYLTLRKGEYICVYDIPDEILRLGEGTGRYMNFIDYKKWDEICEFAIPCRDMKFEYLKGVFHIQREIDIEDVIAGEDVYSFVKEIYDSAPPKVLSMNPLKES